MNSSQPERGQPKSANIEDMSRDVLAILKEARARSQGSGSKVFYLKDGESALVHFLRNHDNMVTVEGHRKFADGKYVQHVCASDEFFKEPCQTCEDAANDWKYQKQYFFYHPVYCHSKIGSDKQRREIAQLLYLEMPAYDQILAALDKIYDTGFDGKGDLTQVDYIISRTPGANNNKSQSKYTVTARQTALPLPNDLAFPSDAKIKSDIEQEHPMQVMGAPDIKLNPSGEGSFLTKDNSNGFEPAEDPDPFA